MYASTGAEKASDCRRSDMWVDGCITVDVRKVGELSVVCACVRSNPGSCRAMTPVAFIAVHLSPHVGDIHQSLKKLTVRFDLSYPPCYMRLKLNGLQSHGEWVVRDGVAWLDYCLL